MTLITANITRLEGEINRLQAIIIEKGAARDEVEREIIELNIRQASLALYRKNLKVLLAAASSVADWQVSDPDDVP